MMHMFMWVTATLSGITTNYSIATSKDMKAKYYSRKMEISHFLTVS